ncbi:hypothetical protein ACFSC3_10740 [Sphingomonas floccifaciens]|uniref:Secreted protein n=1 Tax=Sphingomonas floccifaciens TaxID=1844115 RepID=A0ABW4NDP5_9SPHN
MTAGFASIVAAFLSSGVPGASSCDTTGHEQSSFSRLRRTAIVSCDYDERQLFRRFVSLLALPEKALSIDAVEQRLSIPRLAASYDDPRSARYTASMNGTDGGWQATITFTEQFFPLDAWRRPRFRAGLRPRLIDPKTRGEITVDLTMMPTKPLNSPCSLAMDAVVGAGRRYGWRSETVIVVPTHGMSSPRTILRRGRSNVSIDVGQRDCVTGLVLGRVADGGAN